MSDDHLIRDAGNDLVEYARNFGEEETRSLTELLFPAIFLASKRMSSRAISRWLKENKGIKFSATSVAKALRNQERYFENIADRAFPIAEHVANSLGLDVAELLTEETPPPDLLAQEQMPTVIDGDHYHDLRNYLDSAISQLREDWFNLDREIRYRALQYFDFSDATEHDDEN